jgi:hypothetical protein
MSSLHIEFKRPFTIISIGLFVERFMNDVLKSYPGLRRNVRMHMMVNPVIIQHKNVNKIEMGDPINRCSTVRESKLDMLMDVRPYVSINSSFQWYTYENDVPSR